MSAFDNQIFSSGAWNPRTGKTVLATQNEIFMVTIPQMPLTLNALPNDIAEMFQLLQFPFAFEEAVTIGINEFVRQKWIECDSIQQLGTSIGL